MWNRKVTKCKREIYTDILRVDKWEYDALAGSASNDIVIGASELSGFV